MNQIQGNTKNDEPDPLPERDVEHDHDNPKPQPSTGPLKNEPTPEKVAEYKEAAAQRPPADS
jgi:hypothetical protein